jgi:hypothetical protein
MQATVITVNLRYGDWLELLDISALQICGCEYSSLVNKRPVLTWRTQKVRVAYCVCLRIHSWSLS